MAAKLNPVTIYNQQAVHLIRKRAKAEGRSFSNAATQTIIELLKGTYGTTDKGIEAEPCLQGKNLSTMG